MKKGDWVVHKGKDYLVSWVTQHQVTLSDGRNKVRVLRSELE